MLNVKNGKVNNINDVLEEIVRCVTAPSFCVMPWKCVTMAVGDRTDPLVKKSVVHIYRASMNGQNIFQIKVHNCKKEVCDHPICTKDCETTPLNNTQEGKEAMLNETHKRKRKKRNNFSEGNKDMLGCCQVNNTFDEFEKNAILKEHQRSKRRNPITHKNKRRTKNLENKEKPSCTLQIFAEGKTRKLNFQLHPAMKVFLGRALDRIEDHDSKRPRTNSPSYKMPDPCDEFLGETTDGYKSKSAKKHSRKSQSSNKNRRTESVEEFEINLPDNTCLPVDNLDDLYKNHLLTEVSNNISKRVCHWDLNQIPCDVENNRISSGLKINGYLLDNIVPTQQTHNGRGKSCNETDSHIGQAPTKSHNDLLKTGNTYQKISTVPIPESYYERGIRHNRNEGNLEADEEQFQFPDRYQRSFQGHQDRSCNSKYGVKGNEIQNPTDSSRNIFSGNENNPHSYLNQPPCFQNRPSDNIIRTPYVVENCRNNNEHIANDIRHINNRNYSISDNRASVFSTDCLNGPPIYRNNAAIFSPPISHETYPVSTEYGSFLTNGGVYSNGFYSARQYHDFSNHERECLNMRVACPSHHQIPYNQHDIIFPKKYIDRETQMSQEGRGNEKEPNRFDHYRFSNNSGTNAFPESNRKYIRETNKFDHGKEDLEDVPTSDRGHNYRKSNVRNVDDHEETIYKRTIDYQRNVSPGETEIAPEVRNDHRTKKKNRKESEKTNTNNDNRKPESSTSAQYLPSCSNAIESNTPSDNQNLNKIPNIDKKSSYSIQLKDDKLFARKDKKDRNEKYFVDKAYFHQNNNKMFKNANPTAHSNYKLVNNPRTMYENEDKHFFQQQDNSREFKQTKPSNIPSEEKIRNRIKINKRKDETGNSNASQTRAFHHGKTSKEPHITIKRTQSMETTDSSKYLAEEVNVNDASEKSSDILPFLYHFPEVYSNYQLFKHNRSRNSKEEHSREKIDNTNEELCDEEYNSKFFCFPSQISWDHYESLQHTIPNINHYLKVNNARSGRRFEPKQKIVYDNESSKLCEACCKVLKEEKSGEKSKGVSQSKQESRDFFSEKMKENNSQYKVTTNLEESSRMKNENVRKKDLLCDSKILHLNDEQKPSSCPLVNDTTDNNQVCLHKNDDRRDLKENILDNKPKEQNETVKNENPQKRESKMLLHSQSVKKFFNHAKEYLNFRKHSTSSIKSGFSNSVLQIGQLNRTSQPGGVLNRVNDNPIVTSNHSVKASSCKRNNDDSNLNKKQCNKPDNRANSENNIDVSQSENVQGNLCIKLKPTDMFGNNTAFSHTYQNTKLFKPQTHTRNQINLKDEKYRLYGSNEPTVGRPSMEDINKIIMKNEFRILETESECEGFSEEMYSYSSNCSQSEVAKNWVATTRKKYMKHHKRAKVYKKTSSMSVFSSGSNYSNCEVRKEDKFENDNKNAMINATIALSSNNKKGRHKNVEVEGQYQTIQYSKEKIDHKFSDIFSNSIKNNFKKIKGLVKKNQTRHKSKSPRRMSPPKLSSYTETESISALTPVTSTYTSNKSGETTAVTDNNKTNDKFCNHSTTNYYLSDTENVKSDPVIRKIEPDTWHKFLSKGFSLQTVEISDAENMETENTSMSDNSIEEINLKERSHHRILQPFITTHESINTPTLSKTHSSMSGPTGQRREYDPYQSNYLVPSEDIDAKNQSDETILESSCFENPMVDPKTGFRPIFPI